MKGINDSSKKIADIISVIDGIAFQTNILALNAAVEAARAGEQGRGFAVVASEVRSLAGRSADAAKEIKSLITASVERVEQGTALVDTAGATMTEVVNSIKRVTDIMGEISTASSEQSGGVAQIGEAVSQMDHATQQNAALVEESAAAAESLKTQAEQLVEAVAAFRLGSESGATRASAGTGIVKRRRTSRPEPREKRLAPDVRQAEGRCRRRGHAGHPARRRCRHGDPGLGSLLSLLRNEFPSTSAGASATGGTSGGASCRRERRNAGARTLPSRIRCSTVSRLVRRSATRSALIGRWRYSPRAG